MARTDPQVNFRIPAALNEQLKEAAAANNRTITAELVYRLEQSFSHPKGLVGREMVSDVLTVLVEDGIIEFTDGGRGLLANLAKSLEQAKETVHAAGDAGPKQKRKPKR